MVGEILNKYKEYTSFLNKIGKFYNYFLYKNDIAYNYCIEKRELNEESITKFMIGYAPGYEKLYQFIQLNHLNESFLLDTGICNINDRGRLYDRMAGRIVFPIFDLNGNIISFSGRLIEEHSKLAKYKNGPDSDIFSKSFSVFGLFQSLKEITLRKYVLVVEGNIDVIIAHQFGFNFTVSTLGTSLTKEQLLLIHSLVKKIIFCFDSDMAGRKARERVEKMCKEYQIKDIEFIELEGAKDIDEYLKRYGNESLLNYFAAFVL